jgi:hypothetical protein
MAENSADKTVGMTEFLLGSRLVVSLVVMKDWPWVEMTDMQMVEKRVAKMDLRMVVRLVVPTEILWAGMLDRRKE